MSVAALYVFRRFKALVDIRSFIKICLASIAVYFIALQFSLSPSLLPLIYVGLFGIYFGLLLLMKEFSKEDVETFKRIIPLARFSEIRE